jgi:hypothetical protein
MAERRKTEASLARRGDRQHDRRRPRHRPEATDALSALLRAWTTAMIATVLLFMALVVARIADSPTLFGAYRQALSADPEQGPQVEPDSIDYADWYIK